MAAVVVTIIMVIIKEEFDYVRYKEGFGIFRRKCN